MLHKTKEFIQLVRHEAQEMYFDALSYSKSPASLKVLVQDVLEEDLFLCVAEEPRKERDAAWIAKHWRLLEQSTILDISGESSLQIFNFNNVNKYWKVMDMSLSHPSIQASISLTKLVWEKR